MSNIFAKGKLSGYPNVNTPATGQRVAGEAGIVHSTPIIDPTKPVVQQPAQVQQKQQSQPTLDVNSSTAGMDYLNSLYTSKEDEDKLRKASVMNQRILAIGDAIRHIGNIANAAKGAPSQQFNNPVLEEQARYERGKALRDKANQQYFTYQQARAAQDAKAKQWEATFNYNAAKDAANAAALADYRDSLIRERGRIADQNYQLGVRRADDAKAGREAALKETKRYHDITAGQRSQSLKMQRERTTAYVNRANRSGGNGSKQFAVDTAVGTLYAPAEKTKLDAHVKQLYNEAEKNNNALAKKNGWVRGFDGRFRDASGNVVNDSRLVNIGKLKGILGSDQRDYDAAFMAVANNPALAKYAKEKLHWTEQASSGDSMDLGLEDDEDEMDLGLE